MSWSGRERDAAYWGLGDGTFVEAAGAWGLDLPADGRSVARVDWDGDGDLDLWMRARSEPRVRFWENRMPRQGASVRIKLVDALHAIGARLEVWPVGSDQAQPWLRTRRAGEGYLAQSSEWLHVGVGATEEVRLVVRWADGEREEFGQARSGRSYVLKRGEGRWREGPAPWEWSADSIAERSEPISDAKNQQGRTVLAAPHPLPSLRVVTGSGKEVSLGGIAQSQGGRQQRPALLMVWSPDCAPCVQEMSAWSKAREAVQASGLGVIALQVPLEAGADDQQATAWLERIQWPFARATLTEQGVQLLHALGDYFTDRTGPLAVPISFLVDERGRLQVAYLGPVEVETVLGDTDLFGLAGPARLRAAFPFDGLFLNPPKEPRWNRWAQFLAARGLPESADELQWAQVSAEHLGGAKARHEVGEARARQGRWKEALPHLEAAVELAPRVARYQAGLARAQGALELWEESLASWQKALILAPRNAEYLAALGSLYLHLEQPKAAERVWQTLRPLDHERAQRLRAAIDQARERSPQSRESSAEDREPTPR